MSGLSDDERDSLQEAVCDCGDPDCFVVTDVLWDALYASVERIVAARVQAARAEAWDEGANAAVEPVNTGTRMTLRARIPFPAHENPYRATSPGKADA